MRKREKETKKIEKMEWRKNAGTKEVNKNLMETERKNYSFKKLSEKDRQTGRKADRHAHGE